jgi:hypothetical protein
MIPKLIAKRSTGILSESDLDYLVFRLKMCVPYPVLSTTLAKEFDNPSFSLNADSTLHAHALPLFEPNTVEPRLAKSEQLLSQPLSTAPQTSTECPRTSFSDTLNVHMCDFYDDLSPCWSRRCELWEGINDGQSWLWQENKTFSDSTRKHVVLGSQIDFAGSLCPMD